MENVCPQTQWEGAVLCRVNLCSSNDSQLEAPFSRPSLVVEVEAETLFADCFACSRLFSLTLVLHLFHQSIVWVRGCGFVIDLDKVNCSPAVGQGGLTHQVLLVMRTLILSFGGFFSSD